MGPFLVALHALVAAMVLVPLGLGRMRRRWAKDTRWVIDLVAMAPLIVAFEISFVLGWIAVPPEVLERRGLTELRALVVVLMQPAAVYCSWRAVRDGDD